MVSRFRPPFLFPASRTVLFHAPKAELTQTEQASVEPSQNIPPSPITPLRGTESLVIILIWEINGDGEQEA